ncbi:DUF2938 domain-containing protein [Thalassotalea marina]|uniref:Permease n=1 Tax=Thalassotalea marina TaxID=1673741 RepID=A0A919EIT5_9GAMM|nr:DUF2938 domain-containing protein [Thalassotalea marina]GHF88671.1 permease [Thalassotalea marina]
MNYETIYFAVLIGIGATITMDIWAWLKRVLFNQASLDYRLVGRWVLHWFCLTFSHQSIQQAQVKSGELAVGWLVHYLTGIVFAFGFVAVWGDQWTSPEFIPAIITGVATIVFPLFVMQPSFGMGIAARKTPKPWLARKNALITHSIFGLGLYFSSLLIYWIL